MPRSVTSPPLFKTADCDDLSNFNRQFGRATSFFFMQAKLEKIFITFIILGGTFFRKVIYVLHFIFGLKLRRRIEVCEFILCLLSATMPFLYEYLVRLIDLWIYFYSCLDTYYWFDLIFYYVGQNASLPWYLYDDLIFIFIIVFHEITSLILEELNPIVPIFRVYILVHLYTPEVTSLFCLQFEYRIAEERMGVVGWLQRPKDIAH